MRFTYCPDCNRKGVWLHLSDVPGEDSLKCRYCEWFAFVEITWNHVDAVEQARWRTENAARGVPTEGVI